MINSDKSSEMSKKLRLTYLKYIILLFSMFTVHYSLFTAAYADEIQSRAAVVMDAATGRVLYAKNPELRLLPASTTKLMTAMVVMEKAKLTDVVTVSRKAASAPPTKAGLKAGDKVTIETLLYAALMKSANDAAVALAEGVAGSEEEFVSLMNMKAMAIGANNTHYINANGLPGKGQYITAYDLSKIMRQAMKYPVLKEILGTRVTEIATETGKTMFIKNTNKLLWSDDDVLGGKTGYTNKARHCFVCATEKNNETLIVALLGNPRRDLLWKESEALMEVGSNVLSNNEEPVVYLSRSDYDAANLTNAAYTQKTPVRETRKSYKNKKKKHRVVTADKKVSKKRHRVVRSENKVKKNKHMAGHKKSRKSIAGSKKKSKNTNVTEKGSDGDKG